LPEKTTVRNLKDEVDKRAYHKMLKQLRLSQKDFEYGRQPCARWYIQLGLRGGTTGSPGDRVPGCTGGNHARNWRKRCVLAGGGLSGKAIAGGIADGLEIQNGSGALRGERLIPVTVPMAAKAALYLAIREAGMSNVQLARKLGCDEKEVRRMLDPPTPHQIAQDQGSARRVWKASSRKR
jgi:hypothetical protein